MRGRIFTERGVGVRGVGRNRNRQARACGVLQRSKFAGPRRGRAADDFVVFIPLVALRAVNVPASGVLAPITVLSSALAAVGFIVSAPTGLIVTVPVPVGEIATL